MIKHLRRKESIIVIAILIIALILTVYYAFFNTEEPEEKSELYNIVKEHIGKNIALIDSSEEWFFDDFYNYSVTYPPFWKVEEVYQRVEGKEHLITVFDPEYISVEEGSSILKVELYLQKWDQDLGSYLEQNSIETEILKRDEDTEYTKQVESSDAINNYYYFYYLRSGELYELKGIVPIAANENIVNSIIQIGESFEWL